METTTSIIHNLTDNSSIIDNGPVLYPLSQIEPEFLNSYNIYLYMMVTLGVTGNAIVLVVFLKNRPSTTTDWFILAITVCDFISSFVNVPVYATFTNGYWHIYGTTLICRLHMFLSQSIVLSSSFLICGLALDRYFKICRQISSFTTAFARNACLVITVVTTVLSIPTIFMYENRAGRCVSKVMDTTMFAYFLLWFLIFIFATMVVVFSYYKVTKRVVDSAANIARHANNTRLGEEKKILCCCIPSYRNNRVSPSTATMPRGRLFAGTSFNTSYERSSIPHQNNDLLHVPRKIHLSTILKEYKVPDSSQSEQRVCQTGQTHSITVNNRSEQGTSASLRTTKISFIVCTIFILTWIPPWLCFIFASVPGMQSNINIIKFMIFGRMTYLINGFSNPIIYALLNRRFRNQIFEIFCSWKM